MPKLRHKVEHRRALHHSEVADALDRVRKSDATLACRLGLELLALTATPWRSPLRRLVRV